MAKWIIAIIFIIAFPFAALAQDNSTMEAWVQQTLGIPVPHMEIGQSWKSMPVISDCEYEWSVQWKDAKFQIKDQNENYYRVSYKDDTLTVDFFKEFNGFFGS